MCVLVAELGVGVWVRAWGGRVWLGMHCLYQCVRGCGLVGGVRDGGWGLVGNACLYQCVRGCGLVGGVRVMIFYLIFYGSKWVLAKLVNSVLVWSMLIIDWDWGSFYWLYLMGHSPLHTY